MDRTLQCLPATAKGIVFGQIVVLVEHGVEVFPILDTGSAHLFENKSLDPHEAGRRLLGDRKAVLVRLTYPGRIWRLASVFAFLGIWRRDDRKWRFKQALEIRLRKANIGVYEKQVLPIAVEELRHAYVASARHKAFTVTEEDIDALGQSHNAADVVHGQLGTAWRRYQDRSQ